MGAPQLWPAMAVPRAVVILVILVIQCSSATSKVSNDDSWVEHDGDWNDHATAAVQNINKASDHATAALKDLSKASKRVKLTRGGDTQMVDTILPIKVGHDGKWCWIGISNKCNGVDMTSFNYYVWFTWGMELICAITLCSLWLAYSRTAAAIVFGVWAFINIVMGLIIYFHVIHLGDKGLEQFYGFDMLSAGIVGTLMTMAYMVSVYTDKVSAFTIAFAVVSVAYLSVGVLFFVGVIPVEEGGGVVASWSWFGKDSAPYVFGTNCLMTSIFLCCVFSCLRWRARSGDSEWVGPGKYQPL